MAYYTYSQNNSGGDFTGPAHYVIVEADSPRIADAIAEDKLGLYFDGAGDCDCCGPRWSGAGDWDAADVPSVLSDTDLYRVAEEEWWTPPGKPVVIVLRATGQQDVYRKPIQQPQVEA